MARLRNPKNNSDDKSGDGGIAVTRGSFVSDTSDKSNDVANPVQAQAKVHTVPVGASAKSGVDLTFH